MPTLLLAWLGCTPTLSETPTALARTTASTTTPPTSTKAAQEAPAAQSVMVHADPKGAPLDVQLAEHAAKAYAMELKPVAYLGARWCGPCRAFKKNQDDPIIQEALAGLYLIDIDVDGFSGQFTQAQVMVAAIPHWFPLDAQGDPTTLGVSGDAWTDMSPAGMAPTLASLKDAPRKKSP